MPRRPQPGAPPAGSRAKTRRERPYAGKSRLERRAGRRQQLIDAGLELFGTAGYRETKIERVCAGAGVGIQAFYEEFGRREELFRQIYDQVIGRAYAAVERALEASAQHTPGERLRACVLAYLDAMLVDSRCGWLVSIESGALDRAMDVHRNRTMKRFAALITEALPPDTRRAIGDVRLWSLMLGGAINEVVVDRLLSPDGRSIEALADELSAIWQRTLGV